MTEKGPYPPYPPPVTIPFRYSNQDDKTRLTFCHQQGNTNVLRIEPDSPRVRERATFQSVSMRVMVQSVSLHTIVQREIFCLCEVSLHVIDDQKACMCDCFKSPCACD